MPNLTLMTAAAVAALAAAAPAHARAPEVERWSDAYARSFDCAAYGHAFVNEFAGTQHLTLTTHFDEAGEPVRVRLHLRFRETDRNAATGESVVLHGSSTETYDLAAGTRTITGSVYQGADDQGSYINDSGRVMLDLASGEVLELAGPHEGLFAGVDALVCAALEAEG